MEVKPPSLNEVGRKEIHGVVLMKGTPLTDRNEQRSFNHQRYFQAIKSVFSSSRLSSKSSL